jgi:hypothetical protein
MYPLSKYSFHIDLLNVKYVLGVLWPGTQMAQTVLLFADNPKHVGLAFYKSV